MDNKDEKTQRLLKNDLYFNMLAMMEKGLIKFLDDDDIRLSLKSVQYEYTSEKNVKVQMKIFGNYTHIAGGLVRAAWLANTKTINMRINYI